MTEEMTRQQRRQMIRDEVKQKYGVGHKPELPPDQLSIILKEVKRVEEYSRLVDNHLWMVVETLNRKNIISWEDVHTTESLYLKREKEKELKVKNLLGKTLTVGECVEEIKENASLPAYERLNIHPVKDLNLNPMEIAFYLKEQYPDKTPNEIIADYSAWGLTLENFGVKSPESN